MAEPALNPFVIDTTRLDREWLAQAQHSRAASRAEADAQHTYAQAKAHLAVVAARLLLEIRRNPGKFGLEGKLTEAVVDAAVTTDAGYQRALEAMNLAERDLGYAKANRVAVTVDRRKALENYVELMRLEYVSEREAPPISEHQRRAMDNRSKKDTFGGGLDLDDDTPSE